MPELKLTRAEAIEEIIARFIDHAYENQAPNGNWLSESLAEVIPYLIVLGVPAAELHSITQTLLSLKYRRLLPPTVSTGNAFADAVTYAISQLESKQTEDDGRTRTKRVDP